MQRNSWAIHLRFENPEADMEHADIESWIVETLIDMNAPDPRTVNKRLFLEKIELVGFKSTYKLTYIEGQYGGPEARWILERDGDSDPAVATFYEEKIADEVLAYLRQQEYDLWVTQGQVPKGY